MMLQFNNQAFKHRSLWESLPIQSVIVTKTVEELESKTLEFAEFKL